MATYETRTQLPNIEYIPAFQAADSNKTLADNDFRYQIFTGLTTTRDCILPSSGIKIGDTWTIENTTLFDLVIKASNGNALTLANGANLDATINLGRVVLVAIQNSPSTPAHWRISSVIETFALSAINSNNFSNISFRITRNQRGIIFGSTSDWSVANNLVSQSTVAGLIPLRFRPLATIFARPATYAPLTISINTAGTVISSNGGGGTSIDSLSAAWTT